MIKSIKKIGFKICLMLIICVFLFVGCANDEIGNDSKDDEKNLKPVVAVTIVPEKTFVESVCGDLVDVIVMVPPGSSPENYEPTPQQMQKISKAKVYFSIGVPTEEANILPNLGDVKIISLQDKVSQAYTDRTFKSGERDPHIWLSPKRAKVMVNVIAKEMSNIDKKNEAIYINNAVEYIKQLDTLDEEISASLEGVKNKKFIVYHPAFGYIAEDYDLQMYALEEEGKESTIKHLKEMIDFSKEQSIKVIFYQQEIDSSQSEAFAQEIGGKTMQLEPLAANYIENLKNMAQIMAEVMQ